MLFDSHCHLTAPQLAPDFDGVLARARHNGVTGFLNIADTLEAAHAACEQVAAARRQGLTMWATAGIHPQNALGFAPATLTELRDLAARPSVVAIGEIGLDFVYDDAHPDYPGAARDVQQAVLRAQLALARELGLPVVLHNREADDRLPGIIAEFPGLTGVFHCFGSPLGVARRVLDLGFHLGFTGLVTFKNAEAVREVARFCPLDRLLIETDAPYLAPVPYRGKTNEPAYLSRVAATIAALHAKTTEEIAARTTHNAHTLFKLKEPKQELTPP